MKNSKQQIIPLNNIGVSHLLIPILVVLAVAIGGTFMLVASHADPQCSSHATTSTKCKSSFQQLTGSSQVGPSLPKPKPKVNTADYKPLTNKPPYSSSKPSNSNSSSSGTTAATSTVSDTPPSDGGTSSYAGSSGYSGGGSSTPAPKPDPKGDIIVTTYLNTTAGDAKNGKDQRMGGVKIKVNRIGGNNGCANRKKDTGTTFSPEFHVRKDGTKVKNRGNIHFLDCDTGKYRVTMLGRSGYKAYSSKTREFTLSKNETQKVWFSLEKIVKAKKTPAATETQQPAADTTTTTETTAPAAQ